MSIDFISIPAAVLNDARLRSNDKLLYGCISASTGAEGFCAAGNDALAACLGVTACALSRGVARLSAAGHIMVLRDGNQRRIYPQAATKGLCSNGQTPCSNEQSLCPNEQRPCSNGQSICSNEQGEKAGDCSNGQEVCSNGQGDCPNEQGEESPPHTPPVFRSLDPRDLDPEISRSTGSDPPPIVPPLVEAPVETKAKRKRGNKAVEDPPDFAAFWVSYPRHVAKTTARQALNKLAPDEKLAAEIMAGLESSKKTWKGKDLQYIPHATTWLNQRRWEDEHNGSSNHNSSYPEQHPQQHPQPFDWTGGRITPDDGTQFLEYVRRAREKSGRTGRHEEYDLSLLS